MHGMENQQGSRLVVDAASYSNNNNNRGSAHGSKEMMSNYAAACANSAPLASPRGAAAQQQQCKYKSGKCSNPRATKRNGQLHTLCHFHRVRQNEHQRKSDRKHRMVSVARRAKLGNMGLLVTSQQQHRMKGGGGRHSISSNASDISSDAPPSTPASPMDIDRSYEYQADGAYLSAYHLQNHSRVQHHNTHSSHESSSPDGINAFATGGSSTPTGRLPPISFLTQPGKLDSFRASSTPGGSSASGGNNLTLPPPSSFMSGNAALNSQAGKMA
ncbi:hypothetical protein Gpo141_00007579 [Globisporangium polare]